MHDAVHQPHRSAGLLHAGERRQRKLPRQVRLRLFSCEMMPEQTIGPVHSTIRLVQSR